MYKIFQTCLVVTAFCMVSAHASEQLAVDQAFVPVDSYENRLWAYDYIFKVKHFVNSHQVSQAMRPSVTGKLFFLTYLKPENTYTSGEKLALETLSKWIGNRWKSMQLNEREDLLGRLTALQLQRFELDEVLHDVASTDETAMAKVKKTLENKSEMQVDTARAAKKFLPTETAPNSSSLEAQEWGSGGSVSEYITDQLAHADVSYQHRIWACKHVIGGEVSYRQDAGKMYRIMLEVCTRPEYKDLKKKQVGLLCEAVNDESFYNQLKARWANNKRHNTPAFNEAMATFKLTRFHLREVLHDIALGSEEDFFELRKTIKSAIVIDTVYAHRIWACGYVLHGRASLESETRERYHKMLAFYVTPEYKEYKLHNEKGSFILRAALGSSEATKVKNRWQYLTGYGKSSDDGQALPARMKQLHFNDQYSIGVEPLLHHIAQFDETKLAQLKASIEAANNQEPSPCAVVVAEKNEVWGSGKRDFTALDEHHTPVEVKRARIDIQDLLVRDR